MKYELEPIAHALKEARIRKGLSQRELSRYCGVPQGQISKIENGVVDLRTSSLMALARALDLELSLVPRKSLSAVTAIIRSGEGARRPARRSREWVRLANWIHKQLVEQPQRQDYAQIYRCLRDLEQFSPSLERELKDRLEVKRFPEIQEKLADEAQARHVLGLLREWRNELAQRLDDEYPADETKPAYSLDGDDDA